MWWMVTLPAVAISQIPVIMYWQDSRFGNAPNLIILGAILVGFTAWNLNLQASRDIEALVA